MNTLWPSRGWLAALAFGLGAPGLVHAQPPTVSITAVADAAEAGPVNGQFVIRRTGDTSQPLPVIYSIRGSARHGSDFVRLPGVVTIPAGQTSAPVVIQPLNDSIEEPLRAVEIALATAATPFTLVVVPDTQNYVRYPNNLDFFDAQTRWIAANKDARNIPFVLQEGDCTDLNTEREWTDFKRIMGRLDGVVPYALVPGNHDGMQAPPWDTTLLNTHYPVSAVTNQPGFGGVFEPGKIDNTFHTFRAGGLDWLVLALEFGPRDEVLVWANNVVTNHSSHKAILLTHAHVYTDDKLYGTASDQAWAPRAYGRPNDGVDVWNKLIRHHANFVFAFSGHVLNDGAGRLVMTGDHGNKVYQMLANYQTYPNGGDSWMRLIEFTPADNKFSVRTYGPYRDIYLVHPKHEFEYTNLGLFSATNSTYQIDPAAASASISLHDDDIDLVAPGLVRVTAMGIPPEITVSFSEPVDPATAAEPARYTLDRGAAILGATLNSDLTLVTLNCSPLVAGQTYTLAVNGITDLARTPNSVPPNTRRSIFYQGSLAQDTFDDARLGRWSVIDQGTRDGPSSWNVRFGRMEQAANIHGPHNQATDHRLGTIAWWNTPAALGWSNYTLAATFASADDDGVGLVFRYRDPDNYYKLELDRQRPFRKLIRVADSLESTLATEVAGYEQNTGVRLQIHAADGAFTAWMNGTLLFGGPVTDPSFVPTGTIGLYCWGNNAVLFDDVSVTPTNLSPSSPGTNTNTVTNVSPIVTVTLVPIDAPWKLWSLGLAGSPQGPPGPEWKESDFDDRGWSGPHRAVFAGEDNTIPDPRNWELPLGPISYYFRTRFLMAGSTNEVQLRLRALIDDGAIVHLNGHEILRLGMPPGAVDYTTLAARDVDNASHEGPFDVPAYLVPGTNVLAVEVHQSSLTSDDAVFAVELEAMVPFTPPPVPTRLDPPRLLPGPQLRLTLPGRLYQAYRIESSTNLADWSPALTRTNLTGQPLIIDVPVSPAAHRFYRAFELP